jgi:SPP1 gp7 family putative phage head morphogenesis protein
MAANQELTERSARHAVYIQRFAGGLDNKFLPFLERLKSEVSSRVARTDFQQGRIDALLREITSIQESVYSSYGEQLTLDLNEWAVDEADWQARSLGSVLEPEIGVPAAPQIITAASTTPLVFPDSNIAKTMDSFIKDWSASEIQRVNNIIRTGVATGSTNQEMVRALDAVFDKPVRRNNEAIVRTAVNHMSTVAREQTLQDNSDIVVGYRWISTLDSRTSSQCRSLDQQVFLFSESGYQPKPPIHPNCRSTTVPEIDPRFKVKTSMGERPAVGDDGPGVVGSQSTYYGWLKRQTAAYQDQTIGKTRGRLLRNGGMTSDDFAKLSVDQKFRPLTLDEMRAKNPDAFEQAGL